MEGHSEKEILEQIHALSEAISQNVWEGTRQGRDQVQEL